MKLTNWRMYCLFGMIFGCYVALSMVYIFRLPLDAGPDEGHHVKYIEVLRTNRRLPVLPGRSEPGKQHLECEQATHPPLYYLIMTLFSAPLAELRSETAWRVLRLLSFAQGAIALSVLFKSARVLWPDQPLAATAVGIVALMPQYQYMTAVVNNTTGAILASAIVLYGILLLVKTGGKEAGAWWLLAAAIAAALLTKLTTAWVIVAVVVCVVLSARQQTEKRPTYLLKHLLISCGPGLLLLGLWLARSWHLYGMMIPESATGRRLMHGGLWAALFVPDMTWAVVKRATPQILATLPTPFWLARPLLWPTYWVTLPFLGLIALAVAGFVRTWLRRRTGWQDPEAWHTSLGWVFGGGIIASYCLTISMILKDYNALVYGGRFMLSVLPAAGLLWAIGLRRLTDSTRVRAAILGLVLIALLVVSIWMQDWVITFHTANA